MPMLTTENVVRIVPYIPGFSRLGPTRMRQASKSHISFNGGENQLGRNVYVGHQEYVKLFGRGGSRVSPQTSPLWRISAASWKSKLTRNQCRLRQVGLVPTAIKGSAMDEMIRSSARLPEARLASGEAWTERPRPHPGPFSLQHRRVRRAPPPGHRRVSDPCVAG